MDMVQKKTSNIDRLFFVIIYCTDYLMYSMRVRLVGFYKNNHSLGFWSSTVHSMILSTITVCSWSIELFVDYHFLELTDVSTIVTLAFFVGWPLFSGWWFSQPPWKCYSTNQPLVTTLCHNHLPPFTTPYHLGAARCPTLSRHQGPRNAEGSEALGGFTGIKSPWFPTMVNGVWT